MSRHQLVAFGGGQNFFGGAASRRQLPTAGMGSYTYLRNRGGNAFESEKGAGGALRATAADQNSLIGSDLFTCPLIVQDLVELELDKWLI